MNILNFSKLVFNKSYLSISILGKNYKLNIKYSNVSSTTLIKKPLEIDIVLPKKLKNTDNSSIINTAIMKLYEDIGSVEMECLLEFVRHILKFAPNDYKIERLKNKYYKITKEKVLIINPDIIQFNYEIIITTLIQAFCLSKFKPNSSKYKSTLQNALNDYELCKSSFSMSISAKKIS